MAKGGGGGLKEAALGRVFDLTFLSAGVLGLPAMTTPSPPPPILARYRGRVLSAQDVEFIGELIAAHPEANRRRLSALLCEAWDWRQRNGCLRDMVCRGLMLHLHRQGLIRLPDKVKSPPNPLLRRPTPPALEAADLFAQRPVHCSLRELGPLRIEQVRRRPEEGLVAGLLARHHYLGYTRPVGEHLKYLVWAAGQPIATLIFGSAPRHLAPRDRFIGWSPEARRRNLYLIAINTRYLILPWVNVPHLASHLLGCMGRRLSADWECLYGHPIHYLETFTDPRRFAGTCYRAANWVTLGLTTGRGKNAQSRQPNRPLKMVWGYALTPRFRQLLCGGSHETKA